MAHFLQRCQATFLILLSVYSYDCSAWINPPNLPRRPQTVLEMQSDYSIRVCNYADLADVSKIILDCFYEPSPLRSLQRMAELNRIQNNFPYADPNHFMYVAVHSNNVVGFCDIDNRPATQNTGFKTNPRPYLSDLCVHPTHQQRGVAKALVQTCEDVVTGRWNRGSLFIRVEPTNTVALNMYRRHGYRDSDKESDKYVVLCKDFPRRQNAVSPNAGKRSSSYLNANDTLGQGAIRC